LSLSSVEKFHTENGERLVFCKKEKTKQTNKKTKTLVSTLSTRRTI
jgi:hypothetical protein